MDFGDIIDIEDDFGDKKVNYKSEEVEKTITTGNELINTDLLPKISKIRWLKKWLKPYKTFNLYEMGWRFNLGTSKEWAGLCSSDPTSHGKGKAKNIFVSVDFVDHDKNWLENMKNVILHEMAHAVIQELATNSAAFKSALFEYDAQHRLTQGHGLVWSEVCKKITGEHCPVFYSNADMKESFKNWQGECYSCGNIEYADHESLVPKECPNCGTQLLIESTK
jgi:predicted RNA-binding Zn-ribbon protein involved in translation (DUF1610 family)